MGWVMVHRSPPTELVDETAIPEEPDHEPSLNELNKLETLVATLAKLLSSLLAKSGILCNLDLEKLAQDETLDTEFAKLVRKPRIDLAQKILNGYWSQKFPLFNDIICTRFPTIIQDSSLELGKVNSSDNDWPPPLPQIGNKDLEALVFMHSSFFNLHLYVTELESTSLRTNERLEFLGDAILERAACDLLYHRFPGDNEGQLTAKKTKMVCNARLDKFALLYKFDERLHAQLQEDTWASISENKHKIYADTFEAYVGGLYLDKGYSVVSSWLQKLYEPQAQELAKGCTAKAVAKQDSISQAKGDLYKKVGCAARKPNYICKSTQPPFVVEVWISDTLLGKGEGPNKKEAGNLAAANALANTALIDEQAQIRNSIPRTAPVTGSVSPVYS